MPGESQIEKKIAEYAAYYGCYTRKFTSAQVGVPDRIVVKNGLTVFLEIKDTNKRPTEMQKDEINTINACGGYATWVDTYEDGVSVIDCLINSRADWLRDECHERNYWVR